MGRPRVVAAERRHQVFPATADPAEAAGMTAATIQAAALAAVAVSGAAQDQAVEVAMMPTVTRMVRAVPTPAATTTRQGGSVNSPSWASD